MRISKKWKADTAAALTHAAPGVEFLEVDAHNISPVWATSNKCEFSAKTIRTKIHLHMNTFLTEYPAVPAHPHHWTVESTATPTSSSSSSSAAVAVAVAAGDVITGEGMWAAALHAITVDMSVPEVAWCESGAAAALAALKAFLEQRLDRYSDKR